MKTLALALITVCTLHAAEPEDWWSFKPLKKVALPQSKNAAWARTDIDLFILSALEAKGLMPSPDADAVTLLRRLSFDLTGLPPSPEAIEALSKSAIRNPQFAIDTLLASPQFGERWGRHWLDVARYAESSGRDENVTFPNAWRYRDYVIAAFNADKPYDRFIQEQIAGDLLPATNSAERAQNLIATGFLAVGTKSLNDRGPRQFAVDLADEQISAVGEAVLGMTFGCARCHDHKFDPLTQRDYTALAGIFLSTDTRYGTPGGVQGRNLGTLIELPADAHLPIVAKPMPLEERERKVARRDSARAELRRIMADRAPDNPNRMQATGSMSAFDIVRIFTQIAQLDAELANYDDNGQPKTLAMGALEKPITAATRGPGRGPGGARGPGGPGGPGGGRRTSGFDIIADAPLFARGDILKERDVVPRGMPSLLGPAPAIPPGKSGRLELAQWLTSTKTPLTARVMVNRVWAWIFGRGLVASVDNFGTTGNRPTHPELLDYLAAKFMADGWSVKKLVREIVTSRVYQQSSHTLPANITADPDNTLLWHHTPRRLEAECIRDAMLAASGALDLAPKPGSAIARAGDGPIGGPRNRAMTEEEVAKADTNARSIYLPVARNVPHEALSVFDFPDGAAVRGLREVTNVPTQSLFLLNSEFVEKQSRLLAKRVLAAQKSPVERFDLMCRLVWNRAPNFAEVRQAIDFITKAKSDETDAWTGLARSVFSSAAFRILP